MAVSFASAGRTTCKFGIARNAQRCSTGWWVGPSSPNPIESWVQTYVAGMFMSADSRTAPRIKSLKTRKVPANGRVSPPSAMPFMAQAIANSRIP